MKILFCTNVFAVVENGPVKFANLLLRINELYPEHELRILTEDVSEPRAYVHKVALSNRLKASPFSQFLRMWVYHQAAMRLRDEFPFDVLVYNNALVGLWSAVRTPGCVGMINDYKNISNEKDYYQTGRRSLKEIIFRYFEKLSVRYYGKVIANSDYLTTLIQQSYPRSAGKVFRLYKCVEIPPNPVPFNALLKEPIRILFIKTDYELGGLLVLIQAIGLLSVKVILTIIGPKEEHRARIETASQVYANLYVRYLQYQPQEVVVTELRSSDLFCVPSYKEALGVANLEAMAQGIPVVSTSVGGIPEVLDGGNCGWLVPPGNVLALKNALEECITTPSLRKEKIEKSLAHIRKFEARSMFDTFLKILSQ